MGKTEKQQLFLMPPFSIFIEGVIEL